MLIKEQELALNAAKMRSNGKQRTKGHNGRTKIEPEVGSRAIFDLSRAKQRGIVGSPPSLDLNEMRRRGAFGLASAVSDRK